MTKRQNIALAIFVGILAVAFIVFLFQPMPHDFASSIGVNAQPDEYVPWILALFVGFIMAFIGAVIVAAVAVPTYFTYRHLEKRRAEREYAIRERDARLEAERLYGERNQVRARQRQNWIPNPGYGARDIRHPEA